MPRLLVFNPGHDYALAHGDANYTPPAAVTTLARRLDLLPLVWSDADDLILRADNSVVGADMSPAESLESITAVSPWGWDEAVRYRLGKLGISGDLLPSKDEIDKVRRLSHRRISIKANIFLGSGSVPVEIFNVDDGLAFYRAYPGCYFKMPWSGGGRGVLATAELSVSQIEEWLRGAVRRQGSVLAEKFIDLALEFATLWEVNCSTNPCKTETKTVQFKGVSVTRSDGRGKYHGNLVAPQGVLQNLISEAAPGFVDSLLSQMEKFISQEIAPSYSGLLGIDMSADKAGNLYPCVEINLRRTMGHVAMQYQEAGKERQNRIKSLIPSCLPLVTF